MNKKITLYELLGLVKDGKTPMKIKYKDNIYNYEETENGTGYVRPLNLNGLEWLANRVDIDDSEALNSEVEILDDEDMEIEDVKLIELSSNGILNDTYTDEKHYLTVNLKDKDIYVRKINQLIKNQQILVREINKLKKDK